MQFEANFKLSIPQQECTFVLQNANLEANFELNNPSVEFTFFLS